MSQFAVDPNSAVYTTDEVSLLELFDAITLLRCTKVRTALHHPSGTSKENKNSRHRGNQGLSSGAFVLNKISQLIQSHILAAKTVANIIRTSLGPRGKSKSFSTTNLLL